MKQQRRKAEFRVINTLAGALSHYEDELTHNLRASGAVCEVVRVAEPSQTGASAARWIRDYISALVLARRTGDVVLVTWPLLGFIDLIIVGLLLGKRGWVVLHDPKPLVDARGYGRFAQWCAARFSRAPFLVHSEQARDAIPAPALRDRAQIIAHPMLPPCSRKSFSGSVRVVRTLGQFKPDRDLAALREIGSSLSHLDLEIVGRRWPDVEGWTVRSEFVSEDELDELISSSDVVAVPYRRFFQSGIAIRCLEMRTVVVGPSGTSMEDLLGVGSRLLASERWSDAVSYALTEQGIAEAADAGDRWFRRAAFEWTRWARSVE